jgi:DNA-binding NarL/FixJ family response regulator
MSRSRILIADDHMMFAQGLIGLLEDEFELVGTVPDGQTLVEEAIRLKPDVILVDISMPVLNGFDAVRKLDPARTGTKVIFLTMHADVRLLAEALRCGGMGYVVKQSAGEELVFAIRQVLAGHQYISPVIAEKHEQEVSHDPDDKPHLNLTPRQREVLLLLSEGYTMKQIAHRLGISTRTAESHKYDMMAGLGVDTTAELIQYAVKLGLT